MTRQTKKRKKKITAFGLLFRFFLIVAILIIASLSWNFFGVLSHSDWDGNSRLNLIIVGESPILFSLNPVEENLTLIQIPSKTYLEVPRGFGLYPAGAVFKLGDLERTGGKLVAETIQEFLALPIDGWIVNSFGQLNLNEDQEDNKREVVKVLDALILSYFKNPRLTANNPPFFDSIKVWRKVREARFDKINYIDLSKTDVLVDLILADGTVAKSPDLTKLDLLTAGLFLEPKIKEEHLKIEILNSTGEQGLGNRILRLVQNLGGEVIGVGNAENEVGQCQIKFKKEDSDRQTVKKLAKIFSCQKNEEEVGESRAAIILIIGRDYWQRLNQKTEK